MLNRIFGRLLSALAGRYLDGLAERDLNVSVFSGTVNLANLTVIQGLSWEMRGKSRPKIFLQHFLVPAIVMVLHPP